MAKIIDRIFTFFPSLGMFVFYTQHGRKKKRESRVIVEMLELKQAFPVVLVLMCGKSESLSGIHVQYEVLTN